MSFRRPPLLILTASAFGIACITVLDYATGPELAFSLFYSLPVAYGAWRGGRRVGLPLVILAMLGWGTVDGLDHLYTHEAVYFWNTLVRGGFFLVIALLLVRLRQLMLLQEELAHSDALTGLANGRSFLAALEREIPRCARTTRPLSIAYIDLDNFKHVNDTKGHDVGDELLRSVGKALRQRLRATDLPARLGGDEFSILMPETGAAGAEALIKDLRDMLGRIVERYDGMVSASIGVVTWTEPPPDADAAIRAADALMYAVKRAGKNAFRCEVMPPLQSSAGRA